MNAVAVDGPQSLVRGSRWVNPTFRGVWVVVTVGPKYVTLTTSIPAFGPKRVDRVMWPGSWVPA